MSTRKPETPGHDTDDEDPDPLDNDIGRRFVGDAVLAIERELVESGTDLPNRGIPHAWRSRALACDDPDELREAIEAEVEKEHPNQSLIGWLNEQLDRMAQ